MRTVSLITAGLFILIISSIADDYELKYVHMLFDKGETIPAKFHAASSIAEDRWKSKSTYKLLKGKAIPASLTDKSNMKILSFGASFVTNHSQLVAYGAPDKSFNFGLIAVDSGTSAIAAFMIGYDKTNDALPISGKEGELDADYKCPKRDKLIEMARFRSTTDAENDKFNAFIKDLGTLTGEDVTVDNHLNYIKDLLVEVTEFNTTNVVEFLAKHNDIIIKSFKISMGLLDNPIIEEGVKVDEEIRTSRIQPVVYFNYVAFNKVIKCLDLNECEEVRQLKLTAHATTSVTINSVLMGLGLSKHINQSTDFYPKAASNLVIEFYGKVDNTGPFFKVLLSRDGIDGYVDMTKDIANCSTTEYCDITTLRSLFTPYVTPYELNSYNCTYDPTQFTVPVRSTTPSPTTKAGQSVKEAAAAAATVEVCSCNFGCLDTCPKELWIIVAAVGGVIVLILLVWLLYLCLHKDTIRNAWTFVEKFVRFKTGFKIPQADEGARATATGAEKLGSWMTKVLQLAKEPLDPEHDLLLEEDRASAAGSTNASTPATTATTGTTKMDGYPTTMIGTKRQKNMFLCAASPMRPTTYGKPVRDDIADFVFYIFDKGIRTVVALGPIVDKGIRTCANYFPHEDLEMNEPLQFELNGRKMVVTKTSPLKLSEYDSWIKESELTLEVDKVAKKIKHYHHTAWLSREAPPNKGIYYLMNDLTKLKETVLIHSKDMNQVAVLVGEWLLRESIENRRWWQKWIENIQAEMLKRLPDASMSKEQVYYIYDDLISAFEARDKKLKDIVNLGLFKVNMEAADEDFKQVKNHMICKWVNSHLELTVDGLIKEFNEYKDDTDKQPATDYTKHPTINHNTDIKCFDHNRLVRPQYMHACRVGNDEEPTKFISAQTPRSTVPDAYKLFWDMVQDEKAGIIIEFDEMENGKPQVGSSYYPKVEKEKMTFGKDTVVSTKQVMGWDDGIVRTLMDVSKTNQHIEHYLVQWPDNGCPRTRRTMQRLLLIVLGSYNKVVFLCKDGSSKNGAFIGTYFLLWSIINKNPDTKVLQKVRQQIHRGLNNALDYTYMHYVALEYCMDNHIITKSAKYQKWCEDFATQHVKSLIDVCTKLVATKVEDYQKKMDTYQSPKDISYHEEHTGYNKTEVKCIESSRVKVKHVGVTHDYINANYVGDTKNPKKFILAETPMVKNHLTEKEDNRYAFVSMILQEKVDTIIITDEFKTDENKLKVVDWYPEDATKAAMIFNGTKSKIEVSTKQVDYIAEFLQTLTLEIKWGKNETRKVMVYYWKWSDNDLPPVDDTMSKIMGYIDQSTQSVLVLSADGVGQNGVVAGVWMMIEGSKKGVLVDVLVELRNKRNGSISTKMQYLFALRVFLKYLMDKIGLGMTTQLQSSANIWINAYGLAAKQFLDDVKTKVKRNITASIEKAGEKGANKLITEFWKRKKREKGFMGGLNPLTERDPKFGIYIRTAVPLNGKKYGEHMPNEIHAQFLGIPDDPCKFICTQGPIGDDNPVLRGEEANKGSETTTRFWLMVIQYKVGIIIKYGQDFEQEFEACGKYFRPEIGKTFECGPDDAQIKVTTRACNDLRVHGLVQYQFLVEFGDIKHNVHLYNWGKFLDGDTPTTTSTADYLVDIVSRQTTPVVCHCADGATRSSIVPAMWILEQSMIHGPPIRNLIQFVEDQVHLAVGTPHQYLFIHKVVLDRLRRQLVDAPKCLDQWQAEYEDILRAEYQPMIKYINDLLDKGYEPIRKEFYEAKVKYTEEMFAQDVRPRECRNRNVCLASIFHFRHRGNWRCDTPTMDANFVGDKQYETDVLRSRLYILTQIPSANITINECKGMINDFWVMVEQSRCENIVQLDCGEATRLDWMPTEGKPFEDKDIRVEMTKLGVIDGCINVARLTFNSGDTEDRYINLYTWSGWTYKNIPQGASSPVGKIFEMLEGYGTPTVVQCPDGAMNSGAFAYWGLLLRAIRRGRPVEGVLKSVREQRYMAASYLTGVLFARHDIMTYHLTNNEIINHAVGRMDDRKKLADKYGKMMEEAMKEVAAEEKRKAEEERKEQERIIKSRLEREKAEEAEKKKEKK